MAVKVLIGKKAQLSKKDALNEGIGSAFKVFWNELVGGIDPQELGNNGLVTLGLSGNPRFKAALGAADGTDVMVYDIVRAYAVHAFAGGHLQKAREDYMKKVISGLWGLSNKTDSKSRQQYHNWVDSLASQNAKRGADSSVAATEEEAIETVVASAETVSTVAPATPAASARVTGGPTAVVEPVEDPEEEPETGAEEAEVEGGETEEDSKKETSLEEECSELFDIEDPAIKKLLDKAKADDTIRGRVAEIGRDLSLSADAVTLSMLALTAAFPPALAVTAPVGGVVASTSVISSAVAVIFDLLNGEFKQAAFDAVGLIPLGGGAGKAAKAAGAKTAEKAALKGIEKTAAKGIEKAAVKGVEKAAAKGIEASASAGVRGVKNAFATAGAKAAKLEASLAEKLVGMGMTDELAGSMSKAIMVKARNKIQEKLNKVLGDMPNASDFDSDAEFKKAVSNHYREQKKQSDKIFNACFSGNESRTSKTIKRFLDWIHDWVDEVPRWLGVAVGWAIDAKDSIMGDDEEEAGDEKESEKDLQEREDALYESKSWREKRSLHQEHIENELIKRAIKNGRN